MNVAVRQDSVQKPAEGGRSAHGLQPAAEVLKRFGISRRTLDAWLADPFLAFPRPVVIRERRYFAIVELDAWEMTGRTMAGKTQHIGPAIISDPITDYADLMRVLVGRRHHQRLSCAELEHVSGLQPGYVTKLENWNKSYGRNLGPVSMPLLFGGLKCGVVLVDLSKEKAA